MYLHEKSAFRCFSLALEAALLRAAEGRLAGRVLINSKRGQRMYGFGNAREAQRVGGPCLKRGGRGRVAL